MSSLILIRGGGDLASGTALRLRRLGLPIVITELPQPLVVRRLTSFAEAVYSGKAMVEEVLARRVDDPLSAKTVIEHGEIPVLIDPQADSRHALNPLVLIDGRMTKQPPDLDIGAAEFVIGLGPGFTTGENCHAVIETQRGHRMGRVIWKGTANADTGIPEHVSTRSSERILRAPADGILQASAAICDHLEPGQLVATVSGEQIKAPFAGVLRGLVYPGIKVTRGMKIGDIDPRDDPDYCSQVSDKSLAVAGGVLEAILSKSDLRKRLWDF